jgi:hypothetical protein
MKNARRSRLKEKSSSGLSLDLRLARYYDDSILLEPLEFAKPGQTMIT